jgi:hypothetical protein
MRFTGIVVLALLAALPSAAQNCEVKINGVVVKTVQAANRTDCYNKTSFGSENCKVYASYFKTGANLLEQYFNKTDRVNSDQCTVTPPSCTKTVEVAGMHYPNKTCAETYAQFLAGMMTSYHLKSKCPLDAPLSAVYNVSCQDAPIPGFPNGSVYKATACCGKGAPPVTISNLPMQGGNEKTACPPLNVAFSRADAANVPYLQIMLPNLDLQCGTKGPGYKLSSITFTKCAKDPRGVGFGPNVTANLVCSK